MSFLLLPLEIKYQIISQIPSIDDLAALSQSCRSLHQLCDVKTRKRFHRIRVRGKDASINQTFDLLMEILKEPSLGHYVREIQQQGRPSPGAAYIGRDEQRELSEGDMNLIREAVKRAGFSGTQECAVINMLMQNTSKVGSENGGKPFAERSLGGHGYRSRALCGNFISQALTSILISVSPNLESLKMTQPFYSYWRFYSSRDQLPRESHTDFPLDRFLRRANADPNNIPYLQNLRKAYIIADEASLADDERYYIEIDMIDCTTLFDHLPSIESISTDAVIEDENNCSRLVPRSSNISRFHLNHCALDNTYLAYLAQSSKELREFQYTIGGRAVMGGWVVPFDARVFIKSISPYKETLEVIDIDAEGNTHYLEPEKFEDDRVDEELELRGPDIGHEGVGDEKQQFLRSFWGNTGSLKDFRALKRLSLGIGLLMYFAMGIKEGEGPRKPITLWEELPENLEYLCIRGYERGLYDKWDAQIDSLLKFVDSGSSRVKVIKGIEEMIPNSRDLHNPDNEEDSLWTLKGAGLEF